MAYKSRSGRRRGRSFGKKRRGFQGKSRKGLRSRSKRISSINVNRGGIRL